MRKEEEEEDLEEAAEGCREAHFREKSSPQPIRSTEVSLFWAT